MWWTIGCAVTVDQVLSREGDPVRGAAVYAEFCAECHGADGSGGEGTNLTNDDNPPEALAERILFGWGEMDGFAGQLSVQETADVVAYVGEVIQPSR